MPNSCPTATVVLLVAGVDILKYLSPLACELLPICSLDKFLVPLPHFARIL